MSFVQSQVLDSLSCANCRKYLSYFPIYSHPEQGSFCGRCPQPTEPGFVRNVHYETLARTLKFACCFNVSGCVENLLPDDIPQHEKYCRFLKHRCPVGNSANCKWQGFVQDLLEHTEQKHPTFLLREGQFEVDFVNSHQENYLLPFGEELFIVNRKTDSLTKVFSCTVSYIGSNTKGEDYLYEITLENGAKKNVDSHKIRDKMLSTTNIIAEDIRNVLNDPISIIARIDIIQFTTDAILVDHTYDGEDKINESLQFKVQRQAECPVCFETMFKTICLCTTGHSICEACKENLAECPMCKQGFGGTRNLDLANIISETIFKCKYKKCTFKSEGKHMEKHQATCVFGPFVCPLHDYEGCTAQITYVEIYDHILNNHYENLLETDVVSTPFDDKCVHGFDDCLILRHNFKLFKLHFIYRNFIFQWAMQLIGPADDSAKYKFDIDIIDNTYRDNRFYVKGTCSALSDKEEAFSNDKSGLLIYYEQIRQMVTTIFSYRVRILQG